MFTGIIQAVGRISACTPKGGDVRMEIATGTLPMEGVALGDSIAVDGVCLTVVELNHAGFSTDLSRETLDLTTLGAAVVNSRVNLEKATTMGQPFGGHIVSGHVDGIGRVKSRSADARSMRLEIEVPPELARYIARKGSITVNGISLTVNEVDDSSFGVNIIPHTQEVTTLGALQNGDRVNLEVDLLARYLERLLAGRQ
jgi:riboflavin synthase